MAAKPLSARPRTLAPPPLVYAVGLLLGWWLQQRQPFGFAVSLLVRQLAWGALAASLALMLWAVWTIWRHRTTVNPYAGASTLVTSGPFSFSRNPIYLADALLYGAVTVLLASAWPLCFVPVIWAIMHYGVIKNEEAHLAAKFGAQYAAYCARVRRWL